MSTLVLSLADPDAILETVGGKGASLAKLTRGGLPVPEGFHITTAAYRGFVAGNALQPRILEALAGVDPDDPTTLEPVSLQIAGYFMEGSLPAEIEAAISAATAQLGGIAVAVRSSATAEDLPEASFAGQQDTFLNIRGPGAVLDAVKRCWASLWTGRAIAYRARQGIGPDEVALAVVVQELVRADAAGILFTANPVNGDRAELIVTAAWGLGEAIVGGRVTPDTYTLDKKTGYLTRRETAEKQVMTVRTATGTQEQAVPSRLKKAPVLRATQIKELARLGLAIEQLFGMPVDIEWALAGGKFAIVQARAITALPQPLDWSLPQKGVMLMRGSFAEFIPDPVSPLFATLAIPIAHTASMRLMNHVMGLEDPDSYRMQVLNGYVYIGMRFDLKMLWGALTISTVKAKGLLVDAEDRWNNVRDRYTKVTRQWQEKDCAVLPAPDLVAGVREIFALTAEYYTEIQSGTIPIAMLSELLFTGFYNGLVKRKGDPAGATFVFGADNQALRAEKSLVDLAGWIKGQPQMLEAVAQQPASEICQRLAGPEDGTGWDEFRQRFADYLEKYGHSVYSLDFARPVPSDDPELLVETLKMVLGGGGSDPYQRQQAALEHRAQATDTVVGRLDSLRRKGFLKLLKWAQDTVSLREDSIADLGIGYPQIRKMLAELGRRLAAGGAIATGADIYWLEAAEVDGMASALEKGTPLSSYAAQVEERKAQWQAMRGITPPGTLPQTSIFAGLMPDENQKGSTLKGFGASAGQVTARACVLRGPEEFGKMKPGDILVAVTTTPAWTPLFTRAAAIVTDVGGLLSHSSIVAREYGIPAVLGVGSATKRIHSGQIITVDGTAGTIWLHE